MIWDGLLDDRIGTDCDFVTNLLDEESKYVLQKKVKWALVYDGDNNLKPCFDTFSKNINDWEGVGFRLM